MKRAGEPAETAAAETTASLTIGVDGRIYCHDLTPELLEVVAELCRPDPQLEVRQAAARAMERPNE